MKKMFILFMVLTSATTTLLASRGVFSIPNENDLKDGVKEQSLAKIADATIQATLFVSPTGKGSAFTKANPGSLFSVRNKIKTINKSMTGDIVVSLRGGTYYLDSTFFLRTADGGSNEFSVIYRAASGEQPHLSGGRLVTGWTTAGKGIYKAAYSGPGFRQLYVNSQRAVRAREPNMTNPHNFGPHLRIDSLDRNGKRISVVANEIRKWNGLREVEMIVRHHWDHAVYRIDRFETSGGDTWVYFREPENSREDWKSTCCPGWDAGQLYHYENSIDLLDVPGEWFLDREAKQVYYYPLPGENMQTAEVVAPVLNSVLQIDGGSYLRFNGLVFEHTNWDMPDEARIGIQSGTREGWSESPIRGGILVSRAHNLRFTGNIVRFFGGVGIEFSHSTHNNIIEGNLITDIAGNGIQAYINMDRAPKGNIPLDQQCRNDSIIDNYITRCGLDYTGACGINATFVNSYVIEHNEAWDVPYSAISIGWGWTDKPTILGNNMVRYNNLHHFGQYQDDGAAIYSLSSSPGSQYSYNYVHDGVEDEWTEKYAWEPTPILAGLYLDNGSASVMLEKNVVRNVILGFFASNQPNHDNIYQNNWYSGNTRIKMADTNTFKENTPVSGDEWPSEALDIMKAAGPRIPIPAIFQKY